MYPLHIQRRRPFYVLKLFGGARCNQGLVTFVTKLQLCTCLVEAPVFFLIAYFACNLIKMATQYDEKI